MCDADQGSSDLSLRMSGQILSLWYYETPRICSHSQYTGNQHSLKKRDNTVYRTEFHWWHQINSCVLSKTVTIGWHTKFPNIQSLEQNKIVYRLLCQSRGRVLGCHLYHSFTLCCQSCFHGIMTSKHLVNHVSLQMQEEATVERCFGRHCLLKKEMIYLATESVTRYDSM